MSARDSRSSVRPVKCVVHFLDNTDATFEIERKDHASCLLEKVFSHLSLSTETPYFGLQFTDTSSPGQFSDHRWLEPDKPIRKQMKSSPYEFNFRIKFYPVNPTSALKQDQTRYQLFLQLTKDWIDGQLIATYDIDVLLASYIVQYELGDYHVDIHGPSSSYLSRFNFMPNQSEQIIADIALLHQKHRGLSATACESLYLDTARQLDSYGVHLYKATWDELDKEIQLGVCCSGLRVFQNNQRIDKFDWSDIVKISFKRKQFLVHLRRSDQDDGIDNVYGFNMLSYLLCKNLWRSSIEHHSFSQHLQQQQQQQQQLIIVPQIHVQHEQQTLEQLSSATVLQQDNNISPGNSPNKVNNIVPSLVGEQSSPTTQHVSSQHGNRVGLPPYLVPRVTIATLANMTHDTTTSNCATASNRDTLLCDPRWTTLSSIMSTGSQGQATDPYDGHVEFLMSGASNGSLNVKYTRSNVTAPVRRTRGTLTNIGRSGGGVGGGSNGVGGAKREEQPALYEGSYSVRGVDKGDKNGDFANRKTLFRFSNCNERIVEEDGGDEEEEEDEEDDDDTVLPIGLLTIRLKPDVNGTFGFNVKGGCDQQLPIIVSRVTAGSPADLSIPRLNEGYQVLFINGRDVSQHTHDQVVQFIRASREPHSQELVLIIRPVLPPSLILPDDSQEGDHPNDQQQAQQQQLLQGSKSTSSEQLLSTSMSRLQQSIENGTAVDLFERVYRKKSGMTTFEALRPDNALKNRYRDILPYDETRVKLDGCTNDYINASYVNILIPGSDTINHYIAAQGPLPNTCADFWHMITEQNSTLIVMLTTTMERGRVKCHKYWPDLNQSIVYGDLTITCIAEEKNSSFEFRDLVITYLSTPSRSSSPTTTSSTSSSSSSPACLGRPDDSGIGGTWGEVKVCHASGQFRSETNNNEPEVKEDELDRLGRELGNNLKVEDKEGSQNKGGTTDHMGGTKDQGGSTEEGDTQCLMTKSKRDDMPCDVNVTASEGNDMLCGLNVLLDETDKVSTCVVRTELEDGLCNSGMKKEERDREMGRDVEEDGRRKTCVEEVGGLTKECTAVLSERSCHSVASGNEDREQEEHIDRCVEQTDRNENCAEQTDQDQKAGVNLEQEQSTAVIGIKADTSLESSRLADHHTVESVGEEMRTESQFAVINAASHARGSNDSQLTQTKGDELASEGCRVIILTSHADSDLVNEGQETTKHSVTKENVACITGQDDRDEVSSCELAKTAVTGSGELAKTAVTEADIDKDRDNGSSSVLITGHDLDKDETGSCVMERRIHHMQYLSWPDHGVPDDSSDFLEFVQRVRKNRMATAGRQDQPIVVHCSAGVGRTGVLIAMDTAMCTIEANQPVQLLDIVRNMRDQRPMLIQTTDQFEFVCGAIVKVYDERIVEPGKS